jgi:hypothetical protein
MVMEGRRRGDDDEHRDAVREQGPAIVSILPYLMSLMSMPLSTTADC